MRHLRFESRFVQLVAAFAIGIFTPLAVSAQTGSITGKYEGTAKGADGDVQMTLEIVDEAGKLSGSATTARGTYKVANGKIVDGVLTLEFEMTAGVPAKLSLKRKDDKLVGELVAGGKTGAVELRRVAPDDISGDWDAVADAQGQPFPFSLSLKLDGDKVTGSSSSQLGTSNISTGTWKDGKLAIMLESGSGQIALIATMIEGKLSGDYDFAGQTSGKWVAIKKK